MNYLLKNAAVYGGGRFDKKDLYIKDGRIAEGASGISGGDAAVFDFSDCLIVPGLADVHVHLREPGFSYKETIASGTAAAARGGFTAVCAMPNVSPAPDCPAHLAVQLEIIRKTAVVPVVPYGTVTRGEAGGALSDMAALAPFVAGFSDDGRGVQDAEMMRRAMTRAAALGKIIAAHCEDERLLHGGIINDGAWARRHGLPGISRESEWRQAERDLALAAETGCAYHICHVSTRESVALVRAAKAAGADVTCETAPHYLTLCDEDLADDGRFRMNPPLRGPEDRAALLEGLLDGTVDMIATDHAPHAPAEKAGGLTGSLNGIVGLETAFPVLYTRLVRTGVLTAEKLVALLCTAPRRRFSLGGGELSPGQPADLAVFDTALGFAVDPAEFLSKGRSTPFAGDYVYGRCKLTMAGGKIVWQDK